MITRLGDAERLTAWLFGDLPAIARTWLPSQRWFGGKSRTIEDVDVEDVVWLSSEGPRCALVVVEVKQAAGTSDRDDRERYALVIGFYDDPGQCPTISQVDWLGLQAVEAGSDGRAVLAMLRGLAAGGSRRGERGGLLSHPDATQAAKRVLESARGGPVRVVPIGLEQSNTSVRLGPAHVFKLFRKLDEGENPQIEIGRFLATHSTFRSVPPFEGSLTYQAPDGRSATLGLLEGWIDNDGDGWSYVVSQLTRVADGSASLEALARDMFVLGTTTADFHFALACDHGSPAFAPEPVTPTDVHAWRSALVAQADRVMSLVERHHAEWPPAARDLGRALLASRPLVFERPAADVGPGRSFQKIRTHGDYHLGQTLKTAEGFTLIDFEGEPARSLGERRVKQCALRDVAGMIRSFDYAAETVNERPGRVEGRRLSSSALRDPFVEGYTTNATAGGALFVPSAPDVLKSWIGFFALEKALYEVEYEINNRPGWVHIPLRGAIRLTRSNPS